MKSRTRRRALASIENTRFALAVDFVLLWWSMSPPEDPDVEAYRARLKRGTPIRVSPKLVLAIAAPLAGVALFAFGAWQARREADLPPPSLPSAPSSPPAPPTPGSLVMKALQTVADTYAPMDGSSLEEASVNLARGRKVTFVKQSLAFDPETARLLEHPIHSNTAVVMLPTGFDPGAAGPFATVPEEAGVVVLVHETMRNVGTYTGGKEPAFEIEYEAVALLVPEAKRIASFRHLAGPPSSATRYGTGQHSVLVGGLTQDDGSWMEKAAVALRDGRAPSP